MAESFLLGMGSGSACILTCGMAIFPFLMSESQGMKSIAANISILLLTRLAVYFIMATVIWFFGQAVLRTPVAAGIIPGLLYLVFSVMLIRHSVIKERERRCPARLVNAAGKGRLVPLMAGLINSIGLCPALYLMLTRGSEQHSLAGSYLGFLAFFAGSSLWFIPLPLAGRLRKRQVFETIGILATGLAGLIFMIKGVTNIIGGILNGN